MLYSVILVRIDKYVRQNYLTIKIERYETNNIGCGHNACYCFLQK